MNESELLVAQPMEMEEITTHVRKFGHATSTVYTKRELKWQAQILEDLQDVSHIVETLASTILWI
jgi:hypothetical protein